MPSTHSLLLISGDVLLINWTCLPFGVGFRAGFMAGLGMGLGFLFFGTKLSSTMSDMKLLRKE